MKKESATVSYNNMDESQKHYVDRSCQTQEYIWFYIYEQAKVIYNSRYQNSEWLVERVYNLIIVVIWVFIFPSDLTELYIFLIKNWAGVTFAERMKSKHSKTM